MKKALLLIASLMIIGHAPYRLAYAAGEDRLAAMLAAQPDEVRARYKFRRPQETLTFFGIEPAMTVVEVLPGGGWYTKILIPYLGEEGKVIGADYSLDMWPLFGFFGEDFLEQKQTWANDWPAGAQEWRGDDSAEISAFVLGSMPESLRGTADAVLFIRALHNLARFETEGAFLTAAIKDAFDVLRPGGVVGIVQHHARDNMPDSWADGQMGYLKKGYVIEAMEAAGFKFVAESDMHANSNDQPTTEEFVWRLPPGYQGSADNPELKAKMDGIGESNRMTLRFRKP